MAADLPRRIVAEALGTAMLVATVVGSGIMADRLTDDVGSCAARQHAADWSDPGGADHHTRADFRGAFQSGGDAGLRAQARNRCDRGVGLCRGPGRRRRRRDAAGARHVRTAAAAGLRKPCGPETDNGLPELVAAFGLVFTILAGLRFRSDAIPWLVGLYITAAYWFTASTSFANPAVAIARALSNTFAGIRPDRPAGVHRRRAAGRAACHGLGRLAARRA